MLYNLRHSSRGGKYILEVEERVHMSAQLYSKPNRYLKICARKSTLTTRECTFSPVI